MDVRLTGCGREIDLLIQDALRKNRTRPGALFSSQINFKGEASKFLLDFPIRQEAGFQTELSSPLPDQRQQQLPVPSINQSPNSPQNGPKFATLEIFAEKKSGN